MRAAGLILATLASAAVAQPADVRFAIPPTVSPQATADLRTTYAAFAKEPPMPIPATVAEWDRQAKIIDDWCKDIGRPLAKRLGVTMTNDRIGGIAVVRFRPAKVAPGRRTLVYIHGGGYVAVSAEGAISIPALMASAAEAEVISVDYMLAPRGNWRSVTDEVIAVWRGLIAASHAPETIGLLGDSAGGGLAAGSVLKMRDLGLPLPAALYLISPWSDVTLDGDTYVTLAAADPGLSAPYLAAWAGAYAKPEDQRHPYVSPVYGDYAKAFPPTLIQGGTHEIFLSNFVRHYQAIRSGGHEAVLDLYEGMPHDFHGISPDSPEARGSMARAAAFFDEHLKR